MLLPDELYKKSSEIKSDRIQLDLLFPDLKYDSAISSPLLQMSDFNTLIARSQKHKAPVFDLSDDQLERVGVALENTKKSMMNFRALFSDGADRILALTENA